MGRTFLPDSSVTPQINAHIEMERIFPPASPAIEQDLSEDEARKLLLIEDTCAQHLAEKKSRP